MAQGNTTTREVLLLSRKGVVRGPVESVWVQRGRCQRMCSIDGIGLL